MLPDSRWRWRESDRLDRLGTDRLRGPRGHVGPLAGGEGGLYGQDASDGLRLACFGALARGDGGFGGGNGVRKSRGAERH